jgi:hypothetical protein
MWRRGILEDDGILRCKKELSPIIVSMAFLAQKLGIGKQKWANSKNKISFLYFLVKMRT